MPVVTAPLKKFARQEDGVMAMEMAFALLFLTVLILGTFEVPRFLLLGQKMERAASSMSDLVAQIDPADGNVQAKINDLLEAANGLMAPYDLGVGGRVIISSIANPTGDQETIVWQQQSPSGIAATSKIGAQGAAPALPGSMVVREGENIIVAEIVFTYEPLFASLIYDTRTLYSRAFTRPRFSNLTNPPS
ncbi:MAG: hypothetical protein JNL25_13580 [Rhodospirillaceae bacterium]|nr:hypothetical protein [Rhodospirillaceae bacterium]